VNTPYTQLFLTHIDENGNDSPPVLLERFTSPDRAANIPEFVKLPGDAIVEIREEFLDAYSFLRAGMANERTGDYPGAARLYRQGLEIEPNNVEILNALGWTLFQDGKPAEAVAEYNRASALDPKHVKTHNNLALALVELGKLEGSQARDLQRLRIHPGPARQAG
jgi:tetratricopeptide (TPR) repeat protein